MIATAQSLSSLRRQVQAWRGAGERIGFVPTMGNLHPGHYSLVELARQHVDRVVASVFVNPTQFGPTEDFSRYPRTPEADAAGLVAAGCDLLWLPSVEAMYPFGPHASVQVRVPGVTGVLEGAHRPGHFDGVATVVARLFLQVQPDVAVFGLKDYQQLAVIRYLATELSFPVEIIAAPTRREADGLAMSSRNQYLDPEERLRAPAIHRELQRLQGEVGNRVAPEAAESAAAQRLRDAGFDVDYVAVRRRDLQPPSVGDVQLVALIAARLGRTRLIDNLEFERSDFGR